MAEAGDTQLEVVADDDLVYRRLAREWINADGSVNSAAYKLHGKPTNRFSVDLARLTTPEETAARAERPGFGVGRLRVADLRAQEFEVRHAPEQGNYAHCQVEGSNDRRKCRTLAALTELIIDPRSEQPERA